MSSDVNRDDAAAAESYKNAMAEGTDRGSAIDLALARLRALHPGASEVELRSLLVKVLAEDCVAGDT
jgi:uncharacterized protein YoaH (UPF0181 family)